MRRRGAESAAFDLIVASGPNSALPHAQTSERRIEAGDLVVIDIGARFDGYCADMTRTVAVQSASGRAREIYELVYRAQRAAAAAVEAGAVCGEVDSSARAMISEAGYGEAFGHGLGHGVGLEVHEGPRLRRGEEARLAAGHVVTVEPGIYLEGFGGVRLEDLLVVTAMGSETLTGSPMPSELPVI
jgi:Xaa-Pro aminopeptidase